MRSYNYTQRNLIVCRLKYSKVIIDYIIYLGIELDKKGPQSHVRSDWLLRTPKR